MRVTKGTTMGIERITITADEEVIRRAEHVAATHHTTVGDMVREFLEAVVQQREQHPFDEPHLPPLTRAALALSKGFSPSQRPYKELLAEAILQKYEGLK